MLSCLRDIGCVEVKLKVGELIVSKHTIKIRLTDILKKVKKHITESLDVQGKVTYKTHNFDQHPNKKLLDVFDPQDKEAIYVTTDKRPRDLRQHAVKLQLPPELVSEGETMIKIARTTTIGNLKYKVQNEYGIPVEEQSIHILDQPKECQSGTNVLLLPPPRILEIQWHRKEAAPSPSKPTAKKPQQQRTAASVSPYDTKFSSKKKSSELPHSIHPQKVLKSKGIIPQNRSKVHCSVETWVDAYYYTYTYCTSIRTSE